MTRIVLDELADVRAGDKGDTLIVSVLPRGMQAFDLLNEQLTASAVQDHFGGGDITGVTRHVLPHLPALVFRLPGVLGGGVTASTSLDGHGKTLGYYLLTLEIDNVYTAGTEGPT